MAIQKLKFKGQPLNKCSIKSLKEGLKELEADIEEKGSKNSDTSVLIEMKDAVIKEILDR